LLFAHASIARQCPQAGMRRHTVTSPYRTMMHMAYKKRDRACWNLNASRFVRKGSQVRFLEDSPLYISRTQLHANVLQLNLNTNSSPPNVASAMDTLGLEPRASRMLSGCDTTTPCALAEHCHHRQRLPWRLSPSSTTWRILFASGVHFWDKADGCLV